MGIRDNRMMAKAIISRWDIKPEYRDAIIKRLMAVVVDPKSSRRDLTIAAKAIMAAEAQNQSDEHKVIDVRVTTRHDELSGIAADLGIEIGALENAETESGVGTEGTAAAGVEIIRTNGTGHRRSQEADPPK